MARIAVLPQTLINQIAAGEVIVRPASVVKELVENALDAGARRIQVILSESTRDITIVDDGCGMGRDDAELALQRHATSKIRTSDDLSRIATRGFRGEAVPSIASVARVEIRTRPHEALAGTRVMIEGGRIEEISSIGCPPGTRFEVRDLFYNVPARLKFLKSSRSELNALLQIITLQALSQPGVGWRVEVQGRVLIDAPPGQSLVERARALWGSALGDDPIEVRGERHGLGVSGLIARPSVARRDRRYQAFFVNGRPIVSRTLSSALTESMRGLLMVNRFPVAALFLTIEHEWVDVNVHPTKEEVRFRDERAVAGSLYRMIHEALRGVHLVPALDLASPEITPGHASSPPSGGEAGAGGASPNLYIPDIFISPEALARPGALRKPQDSGWTPDVFGPVDTHPGRSTQAQASSLPPSRSAYESSIQHPRGQEAELPAMLWERYGDPEPLGQVGDTYIVAAFGDGLLLIDQHAAHEKILYLELMARKGPHNVQPLLIPNTIEVAPADWPLMPPLLPLLHEMGIEIEEFGGTTLLVRAVPAGLENLDVPGLIQDVAGAAGGPGRGRAPYDEMRQRIFARMACRAAIKAGRRMTLEEMRRLIADMRRHKESTTCPHGRPTMILLPRQELDRQFGRIE